MVRATQYKIPNMIPIAQEEIVVSGTSIGATIATVTDEAVMALFQVKAGTATHFIWAKVGTATAGTAGEFRLELDDFEIVEVWGHNNIRDFRMIRGQATDVTVAAQYFGTR